MAATTLDYRKRLFVLEYLKDLNATEAAKRAGYSKKSARSIGSALLTKHDIRSALAQAMERRARSLEIATEDVVAEIAKIAFSDIRDVIAWDGQNIRLVPQESLGPDATVAVRQIVQQTIATKDGCAVTMIKVSLHDKVRCLELLARHLGMLGP